MQPSEQFTILTAIIDDTRQIDDITEMLTRVCVRLREALDAHNVFVVWEQHGKYDVFAQASPLDERGGYALKYVQVDYNGESFGRDDAWVQRVGDEVALVTVADGQVNGLELLTHVGYVIGQRIRLDDAVLEVRIMKEEQGVFGHELNNLTTPIRGYSDLLQMMMPDLSENQRKVLDEIKKNVLAINDLVNTYRGYKYMDRGSGHSGIQIISTGVDVNHVVVQAQKQLTQMVAERNLTMINRIEPQLPSVAADEQRLIQVLVNLLSNAVKFSHDGESITIIALPVEEMIHVGVRDTGIGISEEDQPKIFTPYFRSTNELALEKSGMGVGLYLAQELIKLHNGEIWFESEEGKGTTFYISLPIYREDDHATE